MSSEAIGWIQTNMNKKFDFNSKNPDICLEDIAHSLSMKCRYNGHTNYFYSVAEHSVLIAKYILEKHPGSSLIALKGLLHDSTEAYLPDLARPLKRMLPKFVKLEKDLAVKIANHFKIDSINHPLVSALDYRILDDERIILLGPEPESWGTPNNPLGVEIKMWTPEIAKKEFINLYHNIVELLNES